MTDATSRTSWVFHPLTAAELHVVGKRQWPDEKVTNLNRRLEEHCRTPLASLSAPKANAATKAEEKKLKSQIAAIDAATQSLEAAGVLAPATMNTIQMRRSDPLRARLMDESRLRELELRSLQTPTGPRPNWALDYFIYIVADACDAAGITVNAEFSLPRTLDSPFLRVLWLAHARLPRDRQAKSQSALFHRARDTGVPWWKRLRNASDVRDRPRGN